MKKLLKKVNSMKQHKRFFIDNFFEKSTTALDDARKSINNNSLFAAQNRIYYSIFYAVVALGYSENFVTVKHKQLMGWFNKNFVYEKKIFDKQLFKIYENAYDCRQESDYSFAAKLNESEVESNYNDAKFFVETVENYLKKE